jgi:hypothetical protein
MEQTYFGSDSGRPNQLSTGRFARMLMNGKDSSSEITRHTYAIRGESSCIKDTELLE